MGIEALTEIGIASDVEGAHARSSVSELPIETPTIVADTPLVQYLQSGQFAEDTNNTSFEECNDLTFEVAILLEVQVEHVVEMDVILESDMITKSNEILGDVNVNKCWLAFMEDALDGDFSFDPGIEWRVGL
ncbi:hypothetical protein LIER_24041 [Lithospermum erythrorhizon]|uniref:Uncharacterized protein n=1 Tax=Lithospermum erythrorhizon TaxID=34254 RepID=A0AAV3R3W9_LITER